MSLIQEIKDRYCREIRLQRQRPCSYMGNHWRNYALRQTRSVTSFVEIDLIFVRSLNGKSGRCSENCKYCAQSACYHTEIEEYPLLAVEKIKEQAKYNEERGVLRYSIVTSGKALNDTEVEHVCESVREIHKESKIKVCVSGGLLNETQFRKLKQAGVTRVHNNLETSRQNFPKCLYHSYL